MDWTIKFTDLAIVFATLVGPIVAVQAQEFIDRRREQHRRRLHVFTVLMGERLNVTPEHVRALNAVPLEFASKDRAVSEIRTAWKVYLNHMGKDTEDSTWSATRARLFIDLLQKMGRHLRYEFDEVELESGFYAPRGAYQVQSDQDAIRQGIAAVFRGDKAIPLAVQSMPPGDPSMIELTKSVLTKLDGVLDDKAAGAARAEPVERGIRRP